MPSQLDALWNEFAAETEEHLDALERLLSDQRGADWTRDEIGALFRYFHSLKGTFLAMGFTNVEMLAHRCEDILSLVREGRLAIDGGLAKLLLRAVDGLKGMREEVIAKRKDAKPASAILRELERHQTPQPVPEENTPAAAADAPLSGDQEMLAIYSELLEQRVPGVALVFSREAQDRAVAAETAGELAYGAEMMGFDALAGCLKAIVESDASDSAGRAGLIDRFQELREQAKIIEEVTGVPSGAAPFAAALTPLLAPDYLESFRVLSAALLRFDHEISEAAGVVSAAAAMRAVALCLGLERSAQLLVLIEERFRSLDPLDTTRLAVIRELAQDAAEALRPSAAVASDLSPGRADSLASQWEATFQAPQAQAETYAGQRLRPEVVATLSDEQRLKIEIALSEGRHAYEILLDLEANPDIAGDIIAWLSSSVETITSHTVRRSGTNCFQFLVFSEHPADWIQSQLAALDPEQACLRGIDGARQAPGQTHGPAAPSPAGASLIRVQSETIDELMAEVGEMRTALASFADIIHNGRIAAAMREARRFGRLSGQDPEPRQVSRRHGRRSARTQILGAYARNRAPPDLGFRSSAPGHSRRWSVWPPVARRSRPGAEARQGYRRHRRWPRSSHR